MTTSLDKSTTWLDTVLWRKSCTLELLLAGLILLAAIVTRFYGLGARTMSHDEVNHVAPSFDFSEGRGYSYDPVTHGPLQFHLLAFSYFLFGDNDLSSRIPAALFSVATVALALFAWRRYLGRVGALVAGLLFLISPYMLFYGRYARNEAFIVVWALLTLYAVLRYLEKGETWMLYFYTAVNAFHFIDKATSYIFAGEVLVFLGGYLIFRLAHHPWPHVRTWRVFLSLLFGGLICLVLAVGLSMLGKGSATPAARPVALIIVFGLAGLAGVVASVVVLVRNLGWPALRQERAFDLLMLLSTLILPLLGALPLKMAGLDPLDYSNAGIVRGLLVVFLLALVAGGLGVWWRRRVWFRCAMLFYALFVLFYTTFFTNGQGLGVGLMGALGYWMKQQGVNRGSQPLYYYALFQVPIYEFLPALGALLALVIGWRKRLWQAQADRPFDPPTGSRSVSVSATDEEQMPGDLPPTAEAQESNTGTAPIPTLALLLFWSASSLAAFTLAGEKMPWLTIHIALPLILTAAWGAAWLVENTAWTVITRQRGWLALLLLFGLLASLGGALAAIFSAGPFSQRGNLSDWPGGVSFLVALPVALACVYGLFRLGRKWPLRQSVGLLLLLGLAGLALLTTRAAYRAAFLHYDLPTEYLVYAHGAPDPKRLLGEIEELSHRTVGGLDIVIAYDDEMRYPYWWYLRHYPNRIDYGSKPTQDLRRAAVIVAGKANSDKLKPIVRQDYLEFEYIRLWWPNQDYYHFKWDEIESEWLAGLPAEQQATAHMPVGEYLRRAWQRLRPFFTDARVRSALWQIWLNRDYREYAALQPHSEEYNLPTWSPADRMYVYIRKDVAAKAWYANAAPSEGAISSDPYAKATVVRVPDLTIGEAGSAAGQFQAPRGLAVAPDGSLYVADSRNHRIQHLAADGKVLQVWGLFGDVSKDDALGGTFDEPWGVAVGPDGSVYVADTWNHRIQKFTADGQFLLMWGSAGRAEQPDGFWGPRAVAVNGRGQVFVADTGNKRIVVFDADGGYITQFSGNDQPGLLDEPVGLALDAQGRVYVADTWNQRVQVFAPDEAGTNYAPLSSWNVDAWYGQSIENKPYLAVDAQGQVQITDPEACRVLLFSGWGTILSVWGQCGQGSDSLGVVSGVAADQAGGVWVSDASNQRVLHFGPIAK